MVQIDIGAAITISGVAKRQINTSSLTAVSDRCSFKSSSWRLASPPPAAPDPWRQLSLVALRSTRASTRIVPASDHSAWTVPLVSIDPWSSDQRDGARESAHQRELALRAVAADRAPTELTGIPNDRAPRAGSSSERSPSGAAGRMTRRDHHLAPRPALVRATMRGDWPCPRSVIALRTSSGSAVRDRLLVRHRPTGVPLRSQDGAASLELIHQQQFIVASQRGVIMRGRKRSGSGRRRERRMSFRGGTTRRYADAQTDAALLALARLLARQAAREIFAREPTRCSDRSTDEGRE